MLTFEIPTRDCPTGRPAAFSANAKCSESERRAAGRKEHIKDSKRFTITGYSWYRTYIAYSPGYRALLAGGRCLIRLALDAEVHDVITADSAIIHHNIYKIITY